MRHSPKRTMRPGGVATTNQLIALQTVVRRLGFVLLRAYELVENDLVDREDSRAEALRDVVKPLCDYMIHFDVTEQAWSGPDAEDEHES